MELAIKKKIRGMGSNRILYFSKAFDSQPHKVDIQTAPAWNDSEK